MSDEVRAKIREVLLERIPELESLSPDVLERIVAFVDEATLGSAHEGALGAIATQPIKTGKN